MVQMKVVNSLFRRSTTASQYCQESYIYVSEVVTADKLEIFSAFYQQEAY